MKRTALKRTIELRSRSAKPRKPRAPARRCTYSARCTGRVSEIVSDAEGYCGKHSKWVADKLVGDTVKERDRFACQFPGPLFPNPCGGRLSACHLIPKGSYPAIRWEQDNIVAGCAGHHVSFDNHEAHKVDWIIGRLGTRRYSLLRAQGEAGKGPTAAEVIRRYRGRE